MLEVRHLKRVYKVKNNDPVFALNDVSLKFQETGLVFILGKSGSGKSTLLNVMGGLDKADEGEIIIEGKSSKDFSSGEMDSYRNTYLGFIFQEYNILSDFTVRENIALALQLQHKKATDEAINSILEQVDLAGYGKRKPNELSGGQKQRVAIARALVKEPKIIFGDEPTGALDSNTGKQVFETLKKLSKDKLVVIVSHDRDFAEHFGDRVIELRDGKVISDITKTSVEAEEAAAGVSLLGENIIRIEKGHKLTAEDLPILNKALESSGEDMFISADAHVNDAFCEAARISKDGKREEFKDTDPDKIKVSEGRFSSIKSHFSLGRAFKMGARSLKVKPFRLAMTILLSTIAFSLFGASASLANFNKLTATKETIKSEGLTSLSVSYSARMNKGFTSSVISEIEASTGTKVYPVHESKMSLNATPSEGNDNYHLTSFSGYIEYNDTFQDDFGFKILAGSAPKSSDEIMISKYAYSSYEDLGFGQKGGSGYLAPGAVNYSSIIGKTITGDTTTAWGEWSLIEYKIVGIYDSKFPSKYDQYRKDSSSLTVQDDAYSALYSLRLGSSAHTVFVRGASAEESEDVYVRGAYSYEQDGMIYDSYSLFYSPSHKNFIYFDEGKTSLGEDEVLVSPYFSRPNEDMGSSDAIDLVFEGAYMSPLADENDLYSYGGASVTSNDLMYSCTSMVREAALYKTCYDKFEDFYENHLDIVKDINEGNKSEFYQGDGQGTIFYSEDTSSYDYSSATDDQKYQLFLAYLRHRLAIPSGGNYINADASSPYASYYKGVVSGYRSYVLGLTKPTSLSPFASFLENVKGDAYRAYLCENCDALRSEFSKDGGFLGYFNGISKDTTVSELSDSEFLSFLSDYLNAQGSASMPSKMKEAGEASIKEAISLVDTSSLSTSLSVVEGGKEGDDSGEKKTIRIVGFDLDLGFNNASYYLYTSKENAEALKERLNAKGIMTDSPLTSALIAFSGDDAKTESFLKFFFQKSEAYSSKDYDDLTSDDYYLWIGNGSVSAVISTASILVILTQVFLYVGIAMAVFSALLFYNFISVSINNKKREIGILRAVGAKKSDVFKIFYSEAFVIAMINFLLSAVLTLVIASQVNAAFRTNAGVSFGIMQPNVFTILMLLGIALGASLISASLPVIRLANKKPIDAIQNR